MVKIRFPGAPIRARVILDIARENGYRNGVELGVFRGDTFRCLVKNGLFMAGVDTWRPAPEQEGRHKDGGRSYVEHDLEGFYVGLREWLGIEGTQWGSIKKAKYPAQLMRMTTTEAASTIPDNRFDFVFIDADHTYEGVKADIENWKPKVRPGGMVIGHDYNPRDFPGVVKAVNEIFPEFSLYDDRVWAARV